MSDPIGRHTSDKAIMDYMHQYAGRYATPIYIGARGGEVANSGTATLLAIGERRLIVTCDHVVRCYERRRANDPHTVFQVGDEQFDPLEHLIDRDDKKDLFVLDASALSFDARRTDSDVPPLEFYSVREEDWLPPIPEVGERVFFGGFPGAVREQSGNQVASGMFNLGLIPVTGSYGDRFTCNIDRTEWRVIGEMRAPDVNIPWGGLSGAPVFLYDHKVLRPVLVGFISEHRDPPIDQLVAPSAALVRANGTIIRGMVR